MIFRFRRNHKEQIQQKEEAIAEVKKDFSKKVDRDIERLDKINRVLSNGVTLKVFHAVGGKHDR